MSREYCWRCARPSRVCLCSAVLSQTTFLPVLLLQHSAEAKHPFTSSRIAALGAESVMLLTGKTFPFQLCLSLLERLSAKRPCLLYVDHNYGKATGDALDHNYSEWPLSDIKSGSMVLPHNTDSLIVLDGSWRNTRELMLVNSWLAHLPVLGLSSSQSSEYILRKSQHAQGLSTIEAIAYVLYCIETNFDLDSYLKPLRALLEQQKKYFP